MQEELSQGNSPILEKRKQRLEEISDLPVVTQH